MMVMRTWPALAAGLVFSNAAAPLAAEKGSCAGGWSGTVQYTRAQSNSDAKTVQRVSGTGTENSNWSMTYNYAAQIAVRATPDPNVSDARANITLASVSTETKTAQDRYVCRNEKTARTMSGNFVTKTVTKANASGAEADVHIGLDIDGRYGVSLGLPDVQGTVSGSDSASFGGQCVAKESVNRTLAETPVTIDGVRFSSSGEDRADPSNPDRLSGSHSVSAYGVTETITWNLRRCDGSLRLVDMKLKDMRFPNWNDWQDIVGERGTTDGNIVRLSAIVANDGPEEKAASVKFRDTYKGDKFDGARPDGLLGELSVTVPSGEQREVTFDWDTSGYAWFDDGRPRLTQRLKAEVEESGKKVDEAVRNLKIAPKPLLLVHGLWSNWKAWESWQNILTTTHSYDWKAYPVGERPQFGKMNTGEEMGNLGETNTIAQNAAELARYIKYAQRDRNAWHVDIVAHSMGGLISRRYIHAAMPVMPDGKPQVEHLVMLGTPNMGSRCANLISAPLELAGRSMEALRELRPAVVAEFNAAFGERKGVEFSILAGNPLPTMCYMFDANDGVVAVPSAIWTIADSEQQSVLHTNMTGTAGFGSFVKPRVAVGPAKKGKAKGQPAAQSSFKAAAGPASAARAGAGQLAGVETDGAPADFSKIVRLAPGQTTKVAIPVAQASNFGMTFVAANTVTATLMDGAGAIVGNQPVGSGEAAQTFRSFYVDRPVDAGTWTLALENTGQGERETVLSTWSTKD